MVIDTAGKLVKDSGWLCTLKSLHELPAMTYGTLKCQQMGICLDLLKFSQLHRHILKNQATLFSTTQKRVY